MYPVLFRVGSFQVTSFGVLVALAALFGLWLFRRELRLSGLPVEAGDVALIGVLAGLAGAKLLWVLEHLGEEPATSLLLSRAGMSWFGGFAGGLGAGLWTMKRRGWPILPVLSAAVPALALGHAIGRIGCFLVGDDYGTPSNLPWAVAFPEGSPPTIERVHPTQLYEAAALIPIAGAMLRWRRRHVSDAWVVGAYLVSTGLLRFAIEFIRVNDRAALGLTVAQWAALALSIAGAAFIFRRTPLAPV
jgi:phosphatidylglycerol:prolipoprotein diacylglycerol transferase